MIDNAPVQRSHVMCVEWQLRCIFSQGARTNTSTTMKKTEQSLIQCHKTNSVISCHLSLSQEHRNVVTHIYCCCVGTIDSIGQPCHVPTLKSMRTVQQVRASESMDQIVAVTRKQEQELRRIMVHNI